MDTKNRYKKNISSKLLGISSIFRDENNQLQMIFDKDDGSQTIKGSPKIDQLQNFKFTPGTIKSPSRNRQASIYASVHNYGDYSTSESGGEQDNDSMASDVLFATADNFVSFAKKHFQLKDAKPESHSKYPITVSLLTPKDKCVHLAAMASWISILKIMGDFPEVECASAKDIDHRPIPFTFIKEQFARKYTKKDIDDSAKKYQELAKDPNIECKDIPFMFPGHNILDHIQFLCSLGMLKNSLRDEIYCQVLKQMTENPSQNSLSRGWLLLYLIVGIFHPTETLMPCLLTYLRESQSVIAPKVEYSLRRSLRNGTRSYPPGWTEFQAIKNYKPILLPVSLMSGDRVLVRVDASTTVKEMCTSIARNLGLQDTTGFSLFATIFDKISNLGDNSHRIMDTICECEYFAKVSSSSERNSPWRLYYRKEYFPPWETSVKDPVAANLITSQVMRGITVEEYSLKESQLVYFAALKYYMNNEELKINKLTKLLEFFLPKPCFENKSVTDWVNLISMVCEKDFYSNKEKTASSCIGEVVDFAMTYLYKSFSRLYDIKQFTSPNIKLTKVTGAIHQNGFSVVDENEEQKFYLAYEEIIILKKKGNWIYIGDIKGINHAVETHQVEDLFAMLNAFQEEVSNNSRVAVSISRCNVPEKMNFSSSLHIQNGDLIVLEQPFKFFRDSEYIPGLCLRTERKGQFSKDVIHPLATCGIPNKSHLNILASYLKATEWSRDSVGRFYSYSLDQYGKDHLQ